MFINRKHKTPRANSGQSTVEYIVLATAVIAAVIFFVAPTKDGKSVFQNHMINAMNDAMGQVDDRSGKLSESHSGSIGYTAPQISVNSATINSLF